MARPCTVCGHNEAHAINVALVSREPYRTIADRYGVSQSALKRHSAEHIPKLLVKAKDAVESAKADDLLIELRAIRDNLVRLSDKAEDDSDYRTAIGGNVARLKYAELLAKVSQIIDERPHITVLIAPHVQDVIVQTLDPYPEARVAVADSLASLEAAS
jgi:hypothetical protein